MSICTEDQKVSLESRRVFEDRFGWATSQHIDLDAPALRTQSFRDIGEIGSKRGRDLFLETWGRHVMQPEQWACGLKRRRQCGDNPDRRSGRPRYRPHRRGGQNRAC
jgi:hypothetical protein